MSSVNIRAATPADLPELMHLWYEKMVIQQQFDSRFTMMADGEARWCLAAETWLSNSACAIYVAEGQSGLVGYIIGWIQPAPLGMFPEQIGHISEIAVDAHSHQGGLGRLLVMALREWFTKHGVECIIASVSHRNAVEQAFWRAQGAGEWMDLLWIK
jgi:ribosomal protein S18 acetylase RimI-like enzyme